MNCPSCGAELPRDARFCIECGVALATPATDATVKLPRGEAAFACPACGAANPADAIFCVRCGRRHAEPLRPQPDLLHPRFEPPAALAPPAPPYGGRRRHGHGPERMLPALFLIGLGLLFLMGRVLFLPGLIMLVGLIAFIRTASAGRPYRALTILVWSFGLIVAFTVPRLFLPVILLAVGLSVLIRAAGRP